MEATRFRPLLPAVRLSPLRRVWVFIRPGTSFWLPFFLYLSTLAPTIYNLDSAELTTAVATGGIIRATGYPLYLLLGRLWVTLLPLGDFGFRLNLFSAFCGAATIFLANLILRRWQIGFWARLGALGLLATAPYFWSLSLMAEVYTLHTALMAGIILSLLRWAEKPSPLRLFLPVFLLVLSLGNHAATVLLIPGCILYVLLTDPDILRQPRCWLAGIAGLLLGATVFLYLPIAYAGEPAFNYAGLYDASGVFHPVDLHTFEGIFWLLSGRTFAGQMFAYSLSEVGAEVANFTRQLWTAFFIVGLGPGIVGLVALWRKDWRQGVFLFLLFLASAIFYINYRVVDKNTMFLPTFLIWALWLGVGYQTVLTWVKAGAGSSNQAAQAGLRVLLILPIISALFWNWQRVDLSDDWSTREQSEAILATVEPHAIIFGWWETAPGVQYLQLTEGVRPDVLVINRFLIGGDDMLALIKSEVAHRPIYINSPPLDLIQTMHVTKEGALYRLQPRQE